MNSTSNLDIVSLCVFITMAVFSPEVAAFVGPYLVIILASTIGASFALARRQTETKTQALVFFLRVDGLAVLLTSGLAAMVSAWKPDLHERVLLAPIALMIGFIADDWPVVLRRIMNIGLEALNRLKPGGGSGNA